MIQLIVSDMDGCLLDSHKNPPENIHDIIDTLKKENILFGICSGRQFSSIYEKMNKRDDLLYIAENGGICVYQKKILHFNTLPDASIHEFVELSESLGCTPVLCGKDTAYVRSSNPDVLKQIERFYADYRIIEDYAEIQDSFCKISVLDLKGSEANCYPHFKKYQDEFEVLVSESIWMDIIPKGQSKGATLKKAAEILKLDLNNAAAFGDYFNDVEMLQAVKYSYAMKNAHPDVKKIARYEAPSNDEAGVPTTILKILREKIHD